jgi:DNA processing protein
MVSHETLHYLALSLIPGLGTSRIHQLLRHHRDKPSELFRLSRHHLIRLSLSEEMATLIAGGRALQAAEKTIEDGHKRGIELLSLAEEHYPQMLRSIYDAPLVLYCLGDKLVAQEAAIAVVGSRRASVYGRQVTQKLARDLSESGLVVVSGLARGIDTYAHLGALEGGGRTVAVLGSGVDIVYPRENRKLYERIREKGCIISEFPCGAFPAPQNFPIRNRIISGLCYGTVIAEASEFSGSLITARLTLEQNRQLWAIPGNVTNPGSYGPNYLIKQGARIVLDKQDIFEELPVYVLDSLQTGLSDGEEKGLSKGQENPAAVPEPDEQRVLKMLSVDSAIHFDTLLAKADFDFPQLHQALLRLEMKGLIRQLPGCQYSRVLS